MAGEETELLNGKENTGWVQERWVDTLNVTLSQQYLASLYGIMLAEFSTTPTQYEQIMSLISVVLNGFIYGAVAATLSSIMSIVRAPHAEYNAKMNAINSWMRSKRNLLSRSVRDQVESFYDAKITSADGVVTDEGAIINELRPAPIADELVELLYARTINRVPLFSELRKDIIVKICLCLQPVPALQGHPVILSDSQATEMYIVSNGRLQVWENSVVAPIRAKCVNKNGVCFWANVFTGSLTGIVAEDEHECAIDLRGKERLPLLHHRTLNIRTGTQRCFGVVRWDVGAHAARELQGIFEDFDIAVPPSNKLQSLSLHENECVEALEVRQGNVLGYATEGDFFGESSLLTHEVGQQCLHDRTVTAVTDCDLCYLRRDDVLELCDTWPALQAKIDSFAKARQAMEEPRRIFNAIDTSGDGSLSHDELTKLLKSQGVNEDDVAKHVQSMDWRGDGMVSFEEFRRWWEKRALGLQSNISRARLHWNTARASARFQTALPTGEKPEGLSADAEQSPDGKGQRKGGRSGRGEVMQHTDVNQDSNVADKFEILEDKIEIKVTELDSKLMARVGALERKIDQLQESQASFQEDVITKLQQMLNATKSG